MRTAQLAPAEDTLTLSIIESVADTANVPPLELTTPLYEAIDPEALERIFDRESAVGEVMFHYHGCEVTVSSDGNVSVKQETQ